MTSIADGGGPILPHSPRHNPHLRFGSQLRTLADVLLVNAGLAPAGPRAALSAVDHLRSTVLATGSTREPLSYLRAGNPSGPRIVLVHGSPGTASGWADYLLAPLDGTEVVAPDRPGFGHSPTGPELHTLAAQAAALRQLLPEDGRDVVLLGHSLGGAVVAWLAATQPHRVKAIVLLASALDPALEVVHPMQRVAARWPMRRALPRAIRHSNQELLALRDELSLLGPMLPAVRAHVLIVHGTSDDLVPVANVGFMKRNFKGAASIQTELLDGHNHFLPWNSVAQVNKAIRLALEMLR